MIRRILEPVKDRKTQSDIPLRYSGKRGPFTPNPNRFMMILHNWEWGAVAGNERY